MAISALLRCLVTLTLAITALLGQANSSSGDLTGIISDPSGARLSGAAITASDPARGISRSTTAGAEGDYRIALLPPGTYKLRVTSPGFAVAVVDNVEIRVGDSVVLPVQLKVTDVASEVTILAEAPSVDVHRTQQSSTIQNQQIRNLPINRRNYLDFALLTPGVVETTSIVEGTDYRVVQAPQSGLSFGGSNGRGNAFSIDGAENFINSGGVRPSVSQEAVAEFQVNRNSFSAEFGNAFGGAVNIVTRSGTNDVRGNIFGFLRHRSLQARNYFDPERDGSAYTRTQAGATLGGPIRRDKTFLFGAFERLDRQETSFVPILQDRSAFTRLTTSQQQLVDALNGSGVPQLRGIAQQTAAALTPSNYPRTLDLFNRNSGNFPYSEDNTQFLGRLDHRFSDRHSGFLRFNTTNNYSENALLGALLAYNRGRNIGQRDYTTVLSNTSVLGPRLISETRAQFGHYTLDITTVDPIGPSVDITGYGLFGRDIFLPSRIIERHYQLSQIFSWNQGAHDIRFGADINPVQDLVHSETFFSGRFSFGENVTLAQLLGVLTGDPNAPAQLAGTLQSLGHGQLTGNLNQPITSLQAYNLGLPTFYQQGFGNPDWPSWSKRYNFFLQDNWRVHPRLTLNAGARYELEVNHPVLGTDPNNIAPRLGLAWSVTEDGRTVVRAGAGLFYSMNNLQVANVADTLAGGYIQQVFVPLSATPGLNNALTGRPLTAADIYQRLLQQGVIGQRPIERTDLLQFGLDPNPNLPFAVIFGIEDDWKNPVSQQFSFEIERGIGGFAVSAAYNWNRGLHLPRIIDRNLRYGPARPNGEPTFTFVNPLVFQRNIFEPSANSFYSAGILQVTRRFSRHWALNAHYTLSRTIDEVTDFNTDYQPHDQLNPRAERALSPFHQKHRFVASAVFESALDSSLLGGWVFSPIFNANSGRPFNVLTGVDNMGDRRVNTHRPLRAGRNIGEGPNYVSVDLRISRRFGLGGENRNLEFIAEGFNLLNRTNFRTINNVVGNVTVEQLPAEIRGVRGAPTEPLSFTSAFDPRQFQLGLKINF
ncbi:MAG TPA: TonB-dependent receptor [Bryobacteraceae bacterium]|nr:TonB-dependent receptor [Bryobacteraceae bacterium]